MNFFTSDTHFFHENLLGDNDFAPRLFDTVDEMNETIIQNWNAVVKERDTVYHMGDIAMHPLYEKANDLVLDCLSRLNGHIVFIKGNHDTRAFFKYLHEHDPGNGEQDKFSFHDVGAIVKFNHHQYYLTHYPIYLGTTVNIRNLHGHIHHYSVPIPDNINVGVDAPELELLQKPVPFGTPLSEHQIDEIADAKAREIAQLR